MTSIALALFFGALLNAGTFMATHYIEKATNKKDDNFDSETNRHNLATEKFDSERYREHRYKLERWEDEQEKKEKDAEKTDQDINKSLELYSHKKRKRTKF